MALSMQLHTGIDYFMNLPIDELNAIAESVSQVAEEVAKHGGKK